MQYSSSTRNYSSSVRDSPSGWKEKDGSGGYLHKKSSYKYEASENNNTGYGQRSANLDQNVDQLDALLEDLKNERQISTRDKDLLSSPSTTYRTIERDTSGPYGTVTKTTRVIKTSKQTGGGRAVSPRVDAIDNLSTSDYSTLKSRGYTGFEEDFQTRTERINETTGKNLSGNRYETTTKVYENRGGVDHSDLTAAGTSTLSTSHLEKDLKNIALTEDILPLPGTKVTTTVRTYTYEVPATGGLSTNTLRSNQSQNISYNAIHHNETESAGLSPQPRSGAHIPPTVVYNTESYSTLNKRTGQPIVSNQSYEVREHHETNTTTRNDTRGLPAEPIGGGGTKTIVYNVNTTENVHTGPEFSQYPYNPATSPRHLPSNGHPPFSSPPPHPGPGPTTNRYFYKESSNVVNTIHGPPHSAPKYVLPADGYPPHGPPDVSSKTYKYSHTTSSHRGPDYGTLPPAPFPVDGMDIPTTNGNPPQKVDDLMYSLGSADVIDKSQIETSTIRKREVETAVASPHQPNKPTVNRAGKEVYYPPGHDMMLAKREEMSAASAAGGRMAKGSGMYEYESGYKSKTKTKSGGAMVPVCLPLCCAMPCSIM